MIQWWLVYPRIYASRGLNELKTKIHPFGEVSTMVVYGMATQGARVSAAMVLTEQSPDIPVSASEGFKLSSMIFQII